MKVANGLRTYYIVGKELLHSPSRKEMAVRYGKYSPCAGAESANLTNSTLCLCLPVFRLGLSCTVVSSLTHWFFLPTWTFSLIFELPPPFIDCLDWCRHEGCLANTTEGCVAALVCRLAGPSRGQLELRAVVPSLPCHRGWVWLLRFKGHCPAAPSVCRIWRISGAVFLTAFYCRKASGLSWQHSEGILPPRCLHSPGMLCNLQNRGPLLP